MDPIGKNEVEQDTWSVWGGSTFQTNPRIMEGMLKTQVQVCFGGKFIDLPDALTRNWK